jgi:uncharacterized membrane protein
MPEVTYVICTLTSLASAVLMLRAIRGPGSRLVFWGAVFFLGMAVNNIALFANAMVEADWSVVPNIIMLASVAALLYGLVWDVK